MTFGNELIGILKKELDVIVELKELALEKTDMIINNKIQDLDKTTREEEKLVNSIGLLEKEREDLLNTWGVATDTPISIIIEKIPEDNSELINLKDRLTKEMEELTLRNKLNQDLIRENLDWIDFNMNLLTNIHGQAGYGDKKNQSTTSSIFDRKV